ncbi:amino acid ABC transporter substrate-binding protein, PAAT family [Duganella sp. CF458]|uniref:substrate-binding periplasmic protein n=1 Tax=Duganella sp. CF458 TaxID=1884368 RepID=UPI0008E19E02|nr:transporter substrate-binding domain-containing protein [Duganella sp. CF458]SFF82042.1 amino acid ABC transporter substrate-binding protein, PAAT family [Duganella sp. CF458]
MFRAAALAMLLSCTAQAAEPARIRFGLQDDIAPFVMPDRHSGLMVDVLRDAMATQGITADFLYLPQKRTEEALRKGVVDVTTGAKPVMMLPGVMSRWPITSFHNLAITRRANLPRLDSVADLARYRVTAFNGASRMLGQDYRDAVQGNARYSEPLTLQSPLLVLKQVDVVISQRDIFNYYLDRQSYLREGDFDLVYHDILGKPNEYWFAFRTAEMRDSFERGIAALYKSGDIDRIFARYNKAYGTSREFFRPLDCRFASVKPKDC